MTLHRVIPLILLTVFAGCSGDATGPSLSPDAQSTAAVPAPATNTITPSVPSPAMDEIAGCSRITATLYGDHESTPIKGWLGHTLVSFDGGTPESGTFLDQGKSHDANFGDEIVANERFRGTETLKLAFADGDTLVEDAQYVAVPASTPDLYVIHETGTLSGTGRFDGASGHVVVTGPFLNPKYVDSPPWTGTITGSVCM